MNFPSSLKTSKKKIKDSVKHSCLNLYSSHSALMHFIGRLPQTNHLPKQFNDSDVGGFFFFFRF